MSFLFTKYRHFREEKPLSGLDTVMKRGKRLCICRHGLLSMIITPQQITGSGELGAGMPRQGKGGLNLDVHEIKLSGANQPPANFKQLGICIHRMAISRTEPMVALLVKIFKSL